MKRLFFIAACVFASSPLWAQDSIPPVTYSSSAYAATPAGSRIMHSRDGVIMELSYDGWNGADSANTKGWSRGFNFAIMYDFPLGKSHFSAGLGLGISTSGVYLKNQTAGVTDTTSQFQFHDGSIYKKNKVATSFLEVPVELRYRSVEDNANKGFKAAIGLKFGALLDAHFKGKRALLGNKEIDKFKSKRFFDTYRVAATVRVGYGNIGLFYSYTLTPLLKQNAGPKINAYSFGLVISGM